jgi:threonine dehydratase
VPPTPQYAWPLLRERLGMPVWVKHENHTPAGAFKVRGGLTYFERWRASSRRARRHRRHPRQPRPVGRLGRAPHGLAPPSSCRTATRSRRTPRCARWACNLLEHGDDFQAAREHAMRWRSERACTWCRPSTATWCAA